MDMMEQTSMSSDAQCYAYMKVLSSLLSHFHIDHKLN